MTVWHIVTGLQQPSGVATFVTHLVDELARLGHEVRVITRAHDLGHAIPLRARVHLHGLWTPWLHRWSVAAHRQGIPVVWSTHGMTAPWSMAHKRWKKMLPWWLYQKHDLASAALLHATTEQEAEWNRQLGFSNPQCVIPLGTELPQIIQEGSDCSVGRTTGQCPLRVLFVGRIYPVKGLMNVVRAAVQLKGLPIRFRLVGPDQAGHQAELQDEAERSGVAAFFDWAGPKYGADLAAEYAACDLLMLPSFTENFGATVVDALAYGKPVLASRQTPWAVLSERRCGWWVDNAPENLARAFRTIAELPREDLRAMGSRGRALVEERYTWRRVGERMLEAYQTLHKDD